MINWTFMRDVGVLQFMYRTALRQYWKRVLREDLVMVLPTGYRYRVAPWDPSAAEVYLTNANVDWGSEKVLFRYLERSGGTFVDVGAHSGYYSLYMMPACDHVIAIEPDPQAFSILRQNLEGLNKVTLINAAASNWNGKGKLRVAGGGYSFMCAGMEPADVVTNVVRISDCISARFPRVSAVKIDVDGADLDVLEGCFELIRNDQPIFLMELSSREEERLFELCALVGYVVSGLVRVDTALAYRVLDKENIRSVKYKMLFLSPPEEMAKLCRLASELQNKGWTYVIS